MGNVFYFDWEVALMLWLQAHLGSFGVKLASLCSAFGEEMILILVMGFCYWCWNKELGVFIGTNFCMTNVWNPMAKNIALRRRPFRAVEAQERIAVHRNTLSFRRPRNASRRRPRG